MGKKENPNNNSNDHKKVNLDDIEMTIKKLI